MGETGAFGRKLGERFGLDSVPSLVARISYKAIVAATEIRSTFPRGRPSAPISREDAYLVATQICDLPAFEYWEFGRPAPAIRLKAGQTTLHDLRGSPTWLIKSPFHCVYFYLPRSVFDLIADEADAPRIGDLTYRPGIGVDDPVLHGLAAALRQPLEQPEQANSLFVEHVAAALSLHVACAYGGMRQRARPIRRGLAPWQEQRAKDMITAHLDGGISLGLLSKECRLSTSQFSRAFRQSTGKSPHQWLLDRRVEKAQVLLRDVNLSLAAVGLACGFADQSHFHRVFMRSTGLTPGTWRRGTQH